MSMVRIRIKGKSIGQIDDKLLEEYRAKTKFRRINPVCQNIIETSILGRPVKSIADLDLAEDYVRNIRYRNIGEYLEYYIRSQLMDDFAICKNCMRFPLCNEAKNKLQRACSKYTKQG